MGKIRSVLLVCTGNSCRSIMAEGLLKKYLNDMGKTSISVHSMGTSAVNGFSPTRETIQVMRANGIDVSNYRSKHVTTELIKSVDLILVMEEAHKDYIKRKVPEAAQKTFLLKEYGREEKLDESEETYVPDPIGAPIDYYNKCYDIINREIERIAKLL